MQANTFSSTPNFNVEVPRPGFSMRMTLLAAALSLVSAPVLAGDRHHDYDHHKKAFCSTTAKAARKACGFEVKDDFWIAVGNCINESDPDERCVCFQEARAEKRDGTPIEPGVFENKHVAPGVGLILEEDMEGNRVELVEFTTP